MRKFKLKKILQAHAERLVLKRRDNQRMQLLDAIKEHSKESINYEMQHYFLERTIESNELRIRRILREDVLGTSDPFFRPVLSKKRRFNF